MGVPEEILRSALCFSISPATKLATLDEAAECIGAVVKNARESIETKG